MSNDRFDALIVVTPSDCKRVLPLYTRFLDNYPYGKMMFLGSPEVYEIVKDDERICDHVDWINENDIIPFDEVHACVTRRLESVSGGEPIPRGVTGWYYQQFLKMQYSFLCKDKYYMAWDGDTIPCRMVNMFSAQSDQPYLDLKYEHHKEYFDTLGKILPGMRKVIEKSFISEHMLFRGDIMRSLIADIEKNDNINGTRFWEKIINAIEPEKIGDSSFSEFETYGTYVALKYPEVYRLREWHSFRLGAEFFDMNTICDRDFEWLGHDFDAISFEKCQGGREDLRGLFDNPEYQKKLSAKKMLQMAQMEYQDGYKEFWDDDINADKTANNTVGDFQRSKESSGNVVIIIVSYNQYSFMVENIKSIRETLTKGTYQIVVVDNASTDGVTEWLQAQDDILLIKNDINVGFGPACNQAAKAVLGSECQNDDLLLLNNDTRLVFDSLYYLKQALHSSDDVGAVGSISNYAGNQQQLDVIFDNVSEYIRYGERINAPMTIPCIERVRLSGFALLIKRKVWDEVGGFDEAFAPGYFEDDALSMEIMKRGYRLKVVRNSFIYHAGSQSFIKTDYESLIENHYKLFVEKYGFDILKYSYASRKVLGQIEYETRDRFSVLQIGCGLGAEIKAVNSLYPNCECVGVELDRNIFDIVKKTESVFGSLDELFEFYESHSFNVLIIGRETIDRFCEEEKKLVYDMVTSDGKVIIKEDYFESDSDECPKNAEDIL